MRPSFTDFKKKALESIEVKQEYEDLAPAYVLRACSKSFISSIIQDFGIWKEKDTQVILTENNLNR